MCHTFKLELLQLASFLTIVHQILNAIINCFSPPGSTIPSIFELSYDYIWKEWKLSFCHFTSATSNLLLYLRFTTWKRTLPTGKKPLSMSFSVFTTWKLSFYSLLFWMNEGVAVSLKNDESGEILIATKIFWALVGNS